MSLIKRGPYWHYEFVFRGHRYRGSTKLRDKRLAGQFVEQLRRRLEAEAAGIAPEITPTAPTFTEWADVYLAHCRKTMRRPEFSEWALRVLLRFWGARPRNPKLWPKPGEDAPFHDLALDDPIRDPTWLIRFERWLEARGTSPDHRNHLRSRLSGMYRLALDPRYRQITGISTNPFRDLARERSRRRTATLTPVQVRAILQACSYHVRLAVAIGALAPKLRRSNILALEWATHLDPELRYITVWQHKTAHHADAPLVVPISAQLRAILEDARRRRPGARYVVTYRGRRVKDVRDGLAAACAAAGVPYGRRHPDGVTFHSLRHSAATLLAELEVPEDRRQAAMGHASPETTAWYTHLRPEHERPVVETLSAALPIQDVVTVPQMRARRKPARVVPFPAPSPFHHKDDGGG